MTVKGRIQNDFSNISDFSSTRTIDDSSSNIHDVNRTSTYPVDAELETYKRFTRIYATRITQIEEKFVALEDKNDSKMTALSNKIERYSEKIEDSKSKVVETLGIFVALFTFVSVQFSFLQNLNQDKYMPLTSILFGSLLVFVIVLYFLVERDNINKNFKVIIIIYLLFFATILILHPIW